MVFAAFCTSLIVPRLLSHPSRIMRQRPSRRAKKKLIPASVSQAKASASVTRNWGRILAVTLLSAAISVAVKRYYETKAPSQVDAPSLWAPVYGMRIVADLHHSEDAFTQGLVCAGGSLWESTGLVGASRVRKISMDAKDGGSVVAETSNMGEEFGEGLAKWDKNGTHLIQLTWHDEKANIWAAQSTSGRPELVSSFSFPGERWGIAMDETTGLFYVSDGSPYVKVYEKNPANIDMGLSIVRQIKVTDGDGVAVHLVNELELIEGQLWANIWMSPLIARINMHSGRVESWISAHTLRPHEYSSPGHQIDVLNGIAYDDARRKIFVTGKLWPRMFEIQVLENQVYRKNIHQLNPFFVDEEKVREIWRSTGKNV